MKKEHLVSIIASLLLLLLAYAALSKYREYDDFRFQLSKSPFISPFAALTAWTLPAGELLVCLTLLFRRTRLLGLFASLFLLSLFTAYIWSMLHLSYYIPCSCGGILAGMDWSTHLYFNLGFVFLSIAGILLYRPATPGL